MVGKIIPSPLQPLHKRILFFFKLWSIKSLLVVVSSLLERFKKLPSNQRPSLLRKYPVRNHLTNRVFIPQSHKAGDIHPLYFNIHGGGFAFCDPSFDDIWCAHLCNTFDILVVSLDYSKAPLSRFPTQTDDIEALVKSVLSDESLPIDTGRVAIGGFSSGGNLALSVVQAPALRGKIHGVVPWYPCVDWVIPATQKEKSRPYRNEKDIDGLSSMMGAFTWGYIKAGEDLMNPRLSVTYAQKEDLPKWIFMLAVEYDMLCAEAKEMIMKLADVKRDAGDAGPYEFEIGTYKWRMVRGVEHGYTDRIGPATGGDLARQRREEEFEEVGRWLLKGPFAKGT